MAAARSASVALLRVAVGLVAISLVTFFATNVIPSDPARAALGRGASAEQLAEYRHAQGLDRPAFRRYVTWVTGFVTLDWGKSIITGRPVRDDVLPRMRRTLTLAITGFLLAVPIAIGVGLYAGKRSGTKRDTAISLVTLLIGSLPEFIIGILLLLIFAVRLGWLPVESSAIAFDISFTETVRAYALPCLTLALVIAPYVTRMMRTNTREVANESYVRAAVLRGLGKRSITYRHILPSASPPVINVLALNLAEVISGVVVVEAVFGFPGAGQLLVQAVGSKDIPAVQALVLIIGAFFIVLSMLADLAVVALTPRLRAAN